MTADVFIIVVVNTALTPALPYFSRVYRRINGHYLITTRRTHTTSSSFYSIRNSANVTYQPCSDTLVRRSPPVDCQLKIRSIGRGLRFVIASVTDVGLIRLPYQRIAAGEP